MLQLKRLKQIWSAAADSIIGTLYLVLAELFERYVVQELPKFQIKPSLTQSYLRSVPSSFRRERAHPRSAISWSLNHPLCVLGDGWWLSPPPPPHTHTRKWLTNKFFGNLLQVKFGAEFSAFHDFSITWSKIFFRCQILCRIWFFCQILVTSSFSDFRFYSISAIFHAILKREVSHFCQSTQERRKQRKSH
jgi:hypothetical protein